MYFLIGTYKVHCSDVKIMREIILLREQSLPGLISMVNGEESEPVVYLVDLSVFFQIRPVRSGDFWKQ